MGWKRGKSKKKAVDQNGEPKKVSRVDKPKKEQYDDIVKENADFEKYYKRQGIISDEEWPEFLAAFQKPLPTTFRLTGYRTQAESILNIIQGKYFHELLNVQGEAEGEKIVPINLPWYPNNFGWQLNLSRKDIRKNEALFRLHNFLVAETSTGNISRQEAVSMIPPIVLDVKPHHKVLDMCAAPGSKTAQLIEMLHMNEEDVVPSGVVVANDADNKRCYMLVHQTKRLQSPCFVIINHDATVLPTITVTKDEKKVPLKFDRILCDVPCSGDGTLRKNLDVWMKFNTANGNNLHGIQYRIAKRAIELLEVGGQMVYSTCSLNPMEDEAVLARLIKWGKGSLELGDASERLKGLVFRKGVSHWIPMNREMQEFTNFEEVPVKDQNLIRPHMFPPTPEEAETLHLDRCIRVLPHLQDTGGFFIALVKKVAPLPWEKDAADPWSQNYGVMKEPPNKKRRRVWGFKEDPFIYFRDDEPVWPEIRDFYGFEDVDPKNLFSRTAEDKKKNIYIGSPAIRDILSSNDDKVKIINTGVKILMRCDNKGTNCNFRLAQEGAHVTGMLMKKRKVKVQKEDLIKVLMIEDSEAPAEIERITEQTKVDLKALPTGSVMLEYHHDEPTFTIFLAAWKGNSSLRVYVSRQERIHYLTMVGADVTKFETNKFLTKASTNAANAAEEDDDSELIEDTIDTENLPESTVAEEAVDSQEEEVVTGEAVVEAVE